MERIAAIWPDKLLLRKPTNRLPSRKQKGGTDRPTRSPHAALAWISTLLP